MAHKNCVVDTARGEQLCLGRCIFRYEPTVTTTTSIALIADGKNNAYDIVSRYATVAAGASAPARFAGAVLHGIVEEAVVLKATSCPYPPPSTKRVFDRGLTMWIQQNEAFATNVISHVADDIIAFAEDETGLPVSKLLFYAEAPVVVSVNAKGESWPRFADLVVASAATRKVLLIIDLFFTGTPNNVMAQCRAKLRGLRYIKSKPVRDTFNLTGIKVAALLWTKPNLFNMAAMVMHTAKPTKKRLTDQTFLTMGTATSAPEAEAVEASKAKARVFLTKMREHAAMEMLVRLKKPAVRMLAAAWYAYGSLIARITDGDRPTIKILTPTSERERLLGDSVFGGRWTAEAIEELDSGVFETTDFTPVFIGKTLDHNNTEEKKIDRHDD